MNLTCLVWQDALKLKTGGLSMKFFGFVIIVLGVFLKSNGISNLGRKMAGRSPKDEYGNRTTCRYCGSVYYGECSASPTKQHVHVMS